jgi:hypothetical protein
VKETYTNLGSKNYKMFSKKSKYFKATYCFFCKNVC